MRDLIPTGASISATPWHSQGIFGGYGPSVVDVIDTLPAVGGLVGGGLATAYGLGTGGLGAVAIPGAAALGGEAGEAWRQNARRMIGAYAPETSADAAQQIGEQGAVQAAAEVGGRAIAAGARAVGRGMVENAVRPPIGLQREFPDVIDTIVKEQLPVGAGMFGGKKGSERAAIRLAEESKVVKDLLAKSTAGGTSFSTSKLAEPVMKLIDDIAEQPLAKADMARLEGMLDEFVNKKGPLSPLDVQKIKQAAQSIAKPIYKAVAAGNAVTADQALAARFNSAIASGAKEAMETIPGVAEGEAAKRSLIGAKKALSQAEMRRLSLMAEGGAAVLGGAAGAVTVPTDDPFSKSAAGWLIARGVLSPRSLSRVGLTLTREETQMLLRQFPRFAERLLNGPETQAPREGATSGR
jgi:hypothetical protein